MFMRLLTLAAGGEARFTWSGTIFIALIYVVATVPAALSAAITRRWWRWLAAAAGALFLMMPAIGVFSEEIGDVDGLSGMAWAGLVAASVATFATVFVAPAAAIWLVDRLKGRAPAATPAPSPEPALAQLG
ncbi:hypothetical protein [Dactylosporangium sp. NPDC000521]|uniref:hypothetical protein n=1 Tax=Dactylosporangium sp. NPDC000521 TaxID=3363975 RepID=UPI0036AD7624